MLPSLVARMLLPLMSRWMTPWSCRYSRPWRTWSVYKPTSDSGMRPNFLMMADSEPFSQYSRTM